MFSVRNSSKIFSASTDSHASCGSYYQAVRGNSRYFPLLGKKERCDSNNFLNIIQLNARFHRDRKWKKGKEKKYKQEICNIKKIRKIYKI